MLSSCSSIDLPDTPSSMASSDSAAGSPDCRAGVAVHANAQHPLSPASSSGHWDAVTKGQVAGPPLPEVQGAYLWGPVGSGKTMLMQLLLDSTPDAIDVSAPVGAPGSSPQAAAGSGEVASGGASTVSLGKRRLHFHEFMVEVHEEMHRQQQAVPKVLSHSRQGLPVYRCAVLRCVGSHAANV